MARRALPGNRQLPCRISTARRNGKLWFAKKDSYSRHERDPFDASTCWRCGEAMRG